MDNYPKEFAPAFNEGGGVETPFEEWWPRVQGAFPHVPEEVARTWLHEHWNYSPYQYLPSADYRFRKVNWDAGDLWNIRTTWADYAPGNRAAYEHGKFLATSPTFLEYRTAMYMKTHGRFPAPIIVLDNQDDHLHQYDDFIPSGYILIEGHRRFNLALYLQREGSLEPILPIWIMYRP